MKPLLLLCLVSGCAFFRAETPAERVVALIRDARTAAVVAKKGCDGYRYAVAIREVEADAVATAACDEAYPIEGVAENGLSDQR